MISRKEANTILEIIEASIRSRSEEDLRQLVVRLGVLIPYELAACALSDITCSSTAPYHIINVTYPSSWLEAYTSERLDRIDPIIKEHRLHFGLQYWPDSYEKHPEAKRLMASACGCGRKAGYSYGLRAPNGNSASLFCFGGRSMGKDIRTSFVLQTIVPHLHQALVRIVAPLEPCQQVLDPGFSRREKEVLKWIKVGKTTWEISMILSISERTVKFHTQNILHKVQATTRAQAVAISVENGFIDVG